METWVFGAILALVGLLVSACSLGKNELGISFMIAGLTSATVGSLIFVAKFKEWIDKLLRGNATSEDLFNCNTIVKCDIPPSKVIDKLGGN